MAGEIDAAWMIDGNHIAFSREGILPANATRIVARTGNFDHCNFTVSPGADEKQIARFTELLLAMNWDDAQVRPLLELEGLKAWLPGRTSGYDLLIRATDDEKFYDAKGNILADDYRY
jgi:ABC-type phosphate/phosphonate transport system substrate-binding protein